MSNAFKWFLLTLYDRYYNTVIGYQGLIREVPNFGYYATKIARRFNEERFLVDSTTGERNYSDYAHINEQDYRIALLIDVSVTETSTTGTGPNSNYCGSMRKYDAYLTQRKIYLRY